MAAVLNEDLQNESASKGIGVKYKGFVIEEA